jgi:hypothetical protein
MAAAYEWFYSVDSVSMSRMTHCCPIFPLSIMQVEEARQVQDHSWIQKLAKSATVSEGYYVKELQCSVERREQQAMQFCVEKRRIKRRRSHSSSLSQKGPSVAVGDLASPRLGGPIARLS